MDKDVQMSACARTRIVHQARAAFFEALDGRGKIRNFHRDVMQAFAALVDEPRDHRIRPGGLEQFDARAAGREHRDFNLLLFYGFSEPDRETELFLVKLERGVERADRDAQVINVKFV